MKSHVMSTRALGVLGLCVVLGLSALFASGEERKPKDSGTIRASELILVDLLGRERLTASARDPKDIHVAIFGSTGNARLTMALSDDNSPSVALHGADGKTQLVLSVLSKDRVCVFKRDENGKMVQVSLGRPAKAKKVN